MGNIASLASLLDVRVLRRTRACWYLVKLAYVFLDMRDIRYPSVFRLIVEDPLSVHTYECSVRAVPRNY
jgi:hypothetical protein